MTPDRCMHNRQATKLALFLLILPLLGCSFLRPKPSYKWYIVVEVNPASANLDALTRETVKVLKARLDRLGERDVKVEIHGAPESGRVRIDLVEVVDRQRVKNFITSRGLLQLFHIASNPSPAPCQTYATKSAAEAAITEINSPSNNKKALPYPNHFAGNTNQNTAWVLVSLPAIIEGLDLKNAVAVPAAAGDDYDIHFTLKAEAATRFGAWTGSNINQYLGVVLNDEVKSIAYIRTQIYDTGMISGRFSRASAQDLAEILNSGPLPTTIRIVEEGLY